MQNLNFLTNLKLEYNIKSFNYIQQNFSFQARSYFIELYLLLFLTYDQWFKSYSLYSF